LEKLFILAKILLSVFFIFHVKNYCLFNINKLLLLGLPLNAERAEPGAAIIIPAPAIGAERRCLVPHAVLIEVEAEALHFVLFPGGGHLGLLDFLYGYNAHLRSVNNINI